MTTGLRTTSLEDVVRRAEELVPRLRERAAATEALRRVPDETIGELRERGLFRVLQPARFGGYELDYGRTQTELCSVLGQGCGSSAWVQCVVACHAWCLAMFPAEAQDAVWSNDPDTLVASAFNAKTGVGRPVEGGYLVEGDWQFSSGCHACDWIILGVPIDRGDGQPPGGRTWMLLPRSDWEIVDVWYAAGLKGSGSNDIRVKGAFVPYAFTLDTDELDGRANPGSAANPAYIYRLPLWSVFSYNVSTPALGIARGALQAYIDYLRGRPDRAGSEGRHLRIAESACEIDAAEGLWLKNAAELEARGPGFGPWPPSVLARIRRDTAYATLLCVRAVDRLALAVGAHGMLEDTPIQRAFRDVHAVANHGANSWDFQALPFVRQALALPPLPFVR